MPETKDHNSEQPQGENNNNATQEYKEQNKVNLVQIPNQFAYNPNYLYQKNKIKSHPNKIVMKEQFYKIISSNSRTWRQLLQIRDKRWNFQPYTKFLQKLNKLSQQVDNYSECFFDSYESKINQYSSQNLDLIKIYSNEVQHLTTMHNSLLNQKDCMYYYDKDKKIWSLNKSISQAFVNFQNEFQQLLALKKNKKKKWNQDQSQKYSQFLEFIKNLIESIKNFRLLYYSYFNELFFNYCNENKTGKELYQNQLLYIKNKSQGYDFKKERKKEKGTKQVEEKGPQRREKEQKEVVRKQDIICSLSELMNKEWDNKQYQKIENFKKPNANLVFIGHVDSGKSTLTGNIIRKLNEISEQEWVRTQQMVKQHNMEAWQLAGIADDQNQCIRGKTVQCAKLIFSLESRRFTLFDAPGHKNYVPNMMMGACQADIAVLIISAKNGQFQSGFQKEGQTKQHAMLAKALGVFSMLTVITKMETVGWSQQRFNMIQNQVSPFLSDSCGFKSVKFIPIDSINNLNIHERLINSWYKGPCLLEELKMVPIPKRDPQGPLRMPIIDKFKDIGNFYVYGKVESGFMWEGMLVTVLPSRENMLVKQFFNAKDQRIPFATAGENVKIRVKKIEERDIERGSVICSNNNYCQESKQFKANLSVLELPDHKKLMSSGYECVLHMHAIAEQIQVAVVEARINPQTHKAIAASFLKPGETGKVTIKITNPVCLEKFEFMPSLGRFTLRDQGKTIGFGEVLRFKPVKKLYQEQIDHLISQNQQNIVKIGQEKNQTEKIQKKVDQEGKSKVENSI